MAYLETICYISSDFKIYSTANYQKSWGIDRIDQEDLPLDNYYLGGWINGKEYKGKGVAVWVFDTGIFTNHNEFNNRAKGDIVNYYDHFNCLKVVVNAWNSISTTRTCLHDEDIYYGNNDGHGHGTHVAGTVGGKMIGVASESYIMGVKIMDDTGHGTYNMIVHAINAAKEAVFDLQDEGIPSIYSMSLSGPKSSSFNRIIASLVKSNIITVAAAGNDGVSASTVSPASEQEAITVMASTANDGNAFSNFGGDIFVGESIKSASNLRADKYLHCREHLWQHRMFPEF